MINTKDLRGNIDRALPVRLTARDYRNAPIQLLSPASAYVAVTADAKVPALFTLSSLDVLECENLSAGVFNTSVRGRMVSSNVGLPITVRLVADSTSGVAITNIDNAVTLHFKPGVSTIAQVEAAITAASNDVCPISVVTPSFPGTAILTTNDVFPKTLVTAVVILEQTTYPGQFVVTFVRDQLKLLLPTGDADPYLWDASIIDMNLQPYSIVSQSRFSMFGVTAVLPQ